MANFQALFQVFFGGTEQNHNTLSEDSGLGNQEQDGKGTGSADSSIATFRDICETGCNKYQRNLT